MTLTVLDCDVGDEHDYSLFALTLPKIQAGRLQNHYAETLWNKQNVTSQVQLHTSPGCCWGNIHVQMYVLNPYSKGLDTMYRTDA